MNRRDTLLALIALGAASAPLALRAQAPARTRRIGYLAPSQSSLYKERLVAFRKALRMLGYAEGENVVIVLRSANKKYDRLPALAAELVDMNVDVIVAAGGTMATLAARNATKTIPIVFPTLADPVAQGVVTSLARPGGNLTGLSQRSAESAGKRIDLLKEMIPLARRFAYLTNPGGAAAGSALREARAAGESRSVALLAVRARGPAELEGAFAEMARRKVDALLVSDDAILGDEVAQIASLAMQRKLPAMGSNPVVPEAGGLASYGPNRLAMYERAAVYVDKILKGANPAELPVESAPRFDFVVNMKTAKSIGIAIPPAVLRRADWVIE